MSIFSSTPHSVTLKRPARTRDTATNATELNYGAPTKTATTRGLLQSRGGIKAISGEGESIPFDAMFFTLEVDVQVDDLLEVSLPFVVGKFVVLAVEPKPDLDGNFDHTEVLLKKETRV